MAWKICSGRWRCCRSFNSFTERAMNINWFTQQTNARAAGCDTSRRDFLKTASAATLGALAAGAPRALFGADEGEKIKPTTDTVIVLWMAGGMAHTETFDPKKYTPFKAGLKPDQVLSTFPHIGSVIARTLGPRNPAVPAFIDTGQRFDLGEGEELKAFHTAGFLGSEYGPFIIANPEEAVKSVRPPAGMSPSRFERRDTLYKKLVEKSPIGQLGSDYQKESLLRSLDNAHRLLSSSAAKAFHLALEPKATYDKYNTGKFGLGCLLARRLTEAGARFIEVTSEYIPFQYWH